MVTKFENNGFRVANTEIRCITNYGFTKLFYSCGTTVRYKLRHETFVVVLPVAVYVHNLWGDLNFV